MSGLHTVQTKELVAGGAFEIDYQIWLNATPERVFTALTDEVNHWWPHTYKDDPLRIVIEPFVGGRFWEQFDESGRGVLYANVEVFDPPTTLRFRGAIGMNRAIQVVFTITLEAQDGGTVLRELTHVAGEVSERLQQGMTKGTEEEYAVHLRAWLEQGVSIR